MTGLIDAVARPELFAPSDAPFWDDPFISSQLLAAHLDGGTAAASRPTAVLQATVDRLLRDGLVGPGSRVLDLGCGPGLVAELLARAGCRVTGLDLSTRSLEHARASAAEAGLDIEYRVQDFLTLDDDGAYDLVLQSYGELSTFADDVVVPLLRRVRRALAPGGRLVADVSTRAGRQAAMAARSWSLDEEGLWRPHRHVVLNDHHEFGDVWCNQYTVVDRDPGLGSTAPERCTTYRMWFRDHTPTSWGQLLADAGLRPVALWDGLDGGTYDDGPWIGVVAEAVPSAEQGAGVLTRP